MSTPNTDSPSLAVPSLLGVVALILIYFIGSPVAAISASHVSLTNEAPVADTGRALFPATPPPAPGAPETGRPSNPEWVNGIVAEIRSMLQGGERAQQISALQTIVQMRVEYGEALDLTVLTAALTDFQSAHGNTLSANEQRLLVLATSATQGASQK
jgi:hypothetical protein